jgi:ABC-type multidrug transport system ATPase subunit
MRWHYYNYSPDQRGIWSQERCVLVGIYTYSEEEQFWIICLTVLGVPGSGCSTFIKTIANHRAEYAAVDGEVLYAGITAQEMAERYRGEVVFNHEGDANWKTAQPISNLSVDDLHFATLTVAQTLDFALSTKTPAKRAEGVSKREFNSTVMRSLLKMLNISHTSSTLVGDAVSIILMYLYFLTSSSVCPWS